VLDEKAVVLEGDDAHDLGAGDRADVARAREMSRRADDLLARGDAAGAERAYQRALETYPGYVACYRGLGRSYALLGNDELAILSFRTYLEHAPAARDLGTVRRWLRHVEGGAQGRR
jgi:tetratricopeptide (TPR) repeat protein